MYIHLYDQVPEAGRGNAPNWHVGACRPIPPGSEAEETTDRDARRIQFSNGGRRTACGSGLGWMREAPSRQMSWQELTELYICVLHICTCVLKPPSPKPQLLVRWLKCFNQPSSAKAAAGGGRGIAKLLLLSRAESQRGGGAAATLAAEACGPGEGGFTSSLA